MAWSDFHVEDYNFGNEGKVVWGNKTSKTKTKNIIVISLGEIMRRMNVNNRNEYVLGDIAKHNIK